MKKANIKVAHTPKTKLGMGDFYGSGVKQKVGKVRDSYMGSPLSPKAVKSKPKSLA